MAKRLQDTQLTKDHDYDAPENTGGPDSQPDPSALASAEAMKKRTRLGVHLGELHRREDSNTSALHFSLLLFFLSAFTAVYLDPAIATQSTPLPPARGFISFTSKGPSQLLSLASPSHGC
ncbi:hypothetical protein L211DRAFT_724221 [Terfezia boudieri ATCC MYA-4762]|uniref:Uncharacterized protein n=1 Tax=Terfezia boudieri ATCC MYA-4762 TaxID=1051890 RepID=A0A3N4L6P2_9PEZI|nr:hypothetical protein L211DRAFT_724221 [Terfezia boudieri ATCC MYA-4762]